MTHHRRGLRRLLRDAPEGDAVRADPRTAPLDERRRAIVAFAAALTERPAAMRQTDVERLRAVGLGDADVLALVEVAAYYAYVNRIADGLGVLVEDD